MLVNIPLKLILWEWEWILFTVSPLQNMGFCFFVVHVGKKMVPFLDIQHKVKNALDMHWGEVQMTTTEMFGCLYRAYMQRKYWHEEFL